MKKEGKRITRWKTGATKLQGAAYLREMAENGWILEDMGYLTYSFREEEPQYLKYRLEERESVLTEEERAAYEKDGWREVCHYELEYIFVKEREPAEDVEADKEEIVQELDWKIQQEQKNEKSSRYGQLAVLGIGLLVVFLMSGFSKDVLGFAGEVAVRFLPWILIAYLASKHRTMKLQREKEEVLDGNILDEYTDWRNQKYRSAIGILIGVLIIGWVVYIEAGWNQKKYDMPTEISYRDIPAIRLENLEEGELERIGKNVSSIKELDGLYLGMSLFERSEYQRLRWLSNFNNYVVEHRHLLIVEQVETDQRVKNIVTEAEINLDVAYYHFILEFLAEKQFQNDLNWEKEKPSTQYGLEEHHIITETAKGNFDELHICHTEFGDEVELHILCREGKQVMEVNYDGHANADDVLVEIQKVFLAQN